MNWEAFAAIGIFTLVLGVVLYVPARWWAKRKVREHPNSNATLRVTRAGFVFFGIFVVLLILGFSQEFLAPESGLGQFVSSSGGRLLFGASVAAVFWLLEVILKSKGVLLVEKKETKNV